MILEEALETIAEQAIPEGTHKYLHVNSREAWIEAVMQMVDQGSLVPNVSNIQKLANGWETLLYVKYSALN